MTMPTTPRAPAPTALRRLAEQLRIAAQMYSAAWMAQRLALEAWEEAFEAGVSGSAEGSTPELAAALTSFSSAAEAAQLLDVDVEEEGLLELNEGLRQLEAVAAAAERLAKVLEAGVLQ